MENILGIDPGASTGYGILQIVGTTATIIEHGHLNINKKSDYRGDALLDLEHQIEVLIEKHNINHIVYEDYSFNGKQLKGMTTNITYRAIIELVARRRQINYDILSISTWKKGIAGRATPTKEQKTKWQDLAQKVMIQEALWKQHGIKFPNHSISESTGKPIKFRYDEVDVVGQLVYFAKEMRKVKTITSKVEVAEDVEVGEKWFVYSYE